MLKREVEYYISNDKGCKRSEEGVYMCVEKGGIILHK